MWYITCLTLNDFKQVNNKYNKQCVWNNQSNMYNLNWHEQFNEQY